jgi:hypothetical protein
MRNLYYYEPKTVAEVRIIIMIFLYALVRFSIIVLQDIDDVPLPSIPTPVHVPMAITIPELQPLASPLTVTEVNQPHAW